MYNLIWKDLFLQKTMFWIYMPVLFVYLFLGTSSIWVGSVFCIVLIMNVFSTDEKSSIQMLLNSLPYTRREIVSSKYIGAIIITFAIVLSIFVGNLVIHREITVWKEIMIIVSLVMVTVSILLPISYKFESRYLVTVLLILFGAYMVVVNFVIRNLNDIIRAFIQTLLTLQNPQQYLLIVISILILYGCSWMLSIRIYSKKVF